MSRPPSMRASASATTRSWTRTAIRWTAIWCTWRATRPSAACCSRFLGKSSAQPSATRRTNWAWRCCGIAIPNSRTCRASCRPSTTASTATAKSPAALVGVKAWDPAAGVCYAASFLPSSPPAMRGNPDARQGAIALHGFYFLYYGLQGVSIPFLPLWFAERGLDSAFIGLIVATALLPKILSTPAVAHVADQTGARADRGGADRLAAALRLLSAGRHAGLAVRRHAAAERRLPLGAAAAGPHGDRQRRGQESYTSSAPAARWASP